MRLGEHEEPMEQSKIGSNQHRARKDDIDTSEVTSVKINELFDSMLPSIRSFILEHGLDPLKLKDISENLQGVIIHKRTLNLSNGWLQGLSNVRRTSDVIFSYKDKVLTLDAILAFDLADISYQYFYKDLLISRKGDIHGRVRNMRIRLIVALDMNKYKIAVPMSKIINMDKFSITLEGNKIDPIVNAAIKVVANAFRTKIINMVNEEFSKMEEQQQSAGQVISSEETTKQPKNRFSHTNESQRNVTRGGSGSRAAASSLSSGNTLLNRRAASKRSSRRCNANARRTAMTMDLQRLITEVHARPAIWDQKNVNYHNRDVILKMWREIARACEVSTDVAKSKWKHLRDNFRNELKKTYRGKCDGGANEHDSKWVWFKSLFFLRDQMNSRVIGCTLSQNCSAALRSSPEETQIEPQIDILEGHEETQFDDLDGDSCQSLLSNDDGLHQVMPPPKMNKIGRKRSLLDAMDNNYSEVDRKRFESLQKRLSVSQEEEDDTYHFLMSVRNPLKSLPLDRQMFIRLKIQELVYNEINSQNQQNRTYDVSQDVKPPRTGNASGAIGSGVGLAGGDAGLDESVASADTNGAGGGDGGGGGVGGGLGGGQTVNDMSNHPVSLLQNCTTEGSSDDTFFG
ncbi:hypothetical protein WN48_02509 [Eufriesea mexicana]|uniref:Transcription factor Adf-1 n=1 Tax=Eufriesea mexicana TaxID=516756 RepID=A0A310SBE7_9HYME|nr:hypothetical protein WN48_02509 [Eufriesea mexicana]